MNTSPSFSFRPPHRCIYYYPLSAMGSAPTQPLAGLTAARVRADAGGRLLYLSSTRNVKTDEFQRLWGHNGTGDVFLTQVFKGVFTLTLFGLHLLTFPFAEPKNRCERSPGPWSRPKKLNFVSQKEVVSFKVKVNHGSEFCSVKAPFLIVLSVL